MWTPDVIRASIVLVAKQYYVMAKVRAAMVFITHKSIFFALGPLFFGANNLSWLSCLYQIHKYVQLSHPTRSHSHIFYYVFLNIVPNVSEHSSPQFFGQKSKQTNRLKALHNLSFQFIFLIFFNFTRSFISFCIIKFEYIQ